MSGPPAQGYKISGDGYAGGGPDGSKGQNTSIGYPGGSGEQANGPAQEIAGTLPNNFSLGQTKAESKGEENTIPNPEGNNEGLSTLGRGGDQIRQPIHSHDIDIPAPSSAGAPQTNDGTRAPNAQK
ncbi:uncharacterized protein FA14DRAFT_159545 [Meira miltonrushii]|uniref:Uncharacterized protein n=1 Tax=Meira miltonrushii TaxID=1280837 RepID=A0A316VIN8_9BASI|nr:uncharacterized protein FA14DRAFT_159545 [Meira miltonrushii]PWN37527.1 hypothetical protein FA14DRAFT_159545 [Meira miltonrushii]